MVIGDAAGSAAVVGARLGIAFSDGSGAIGTIGEDRGTRHKTLVDSARQMLLQIARWLPERRIVAVTDSSFSAIELLDAVRTRICMVTRIRLDARLFAPASPRKPGSIGRPRRTGERLPTLAQRLADPQTPWLSVVIPAL